MQCLVHRDLSLLPPPTAARSVVRVSFQHASHRLPAARPPVRVPLQAVSGRSGKTVKPSETAAFNTSLCRAGSAAARQNLSIMLNLHKLLPVCSAGLLMVLVSVRM